MKKITAIALALLASGSPVAAQDWDGWFAGVSAGYTDTTQINGSMTYTATGPSLEATLGHWWSVDPVMFGFDFSLGIGGPGASLSGSSGTGTSWIYRPIDAATVSFRALAGIPFQDTLVYVAAGPLYANTFEHHHWTDFSGTYSSENWIRKAGSTIALGVEQALSQGVSVKGEVAYNSYFVDPTQNAEGWSAKAGLNYRF